MTESFEEGLGRNTYITLAQVKDYLSISSNTQDARLSNIISYATGVIEHYIGQEILANDYVEIFDGGVSSVYVSRLPLSAVYQVAEFNGNEQIILADPSAYGKPVTTVGTSISFEFYNNAHITEKVKRFGKSSLKLDSDDYIKSTVVPDRLQFGDSDFTIEMFIRIDDPVLTNNTIFEISSDSNNYMALSTANQRGLSFTSVVEDVTTTISGSNTFVEAQQFTRKKWAHIAVTRDYSNETLKLFYNGNTIASASYTQSDLAFTNSIVIGSTFKGYIDEIRVSDAIRYSANFIAPSNRFRPDNDTALLLHLDAKHNSKVAKDSHNTPAEYNFTRDTGEITKDTGTRGLIGNFTSTRKSYPSLTLAGPQAFQPFPSGVEVHYRAGYESASVPLDLQVATLDYIKLLYKQDQEKKGFSFEGERGDQFPLAGNFPPHIRRILDLYRIID